MKILLLILMMFSVDKLYGQELQDTDNSINHAFRFYASIGSGSPIMNCGIGLSYAYEKGDKVFYGWSLDAQVGFKGGLNDGMIYHELIFNTQSSVGVGRRFENGGRFFYDIIGLGYSLSYEPHHHDFEYTTRNKPNSGILINALSFHYTDNSGFYFSWRNNIAIQLTAYSAGGGNNKPKPPAPFTVYNSGNGDNLGIEYRTYFTFGFDFSKLYNPKVYKNRSF